ncbi:hypothetical protein FOXB_04768, partial [Fusarium oxysporum f. sp. conglutinans Fo5176]
KDLKLSFYIKQELYN